MIGPVRIGKKDWTAWAGVSRGDGGRDGEAEKEEEK